MAKILVLDDRPQNLMTLNVNIKVYLNADTALARKREDCEIYFKDLGEWDLIIARGNSDSFSFARDLALALKTQELDTTVIWLGEPKQARKEDIGLKENASIKEILGHTSKLLHITPQQMAELELGEYFAFKIQILTQLLYCPTNVYLKQKDDYRLILKAEEVPNKSELKNFIEGHSEFFVKSNDRLLFTNSFSEQFLFIKKAIESTDTDVDAKLKILDNTLNFFAEEFQREGIDNEVADLATSCVNSLLDISKNFSSFGEVEKKLLSEEYSQRLLYAQIIIFISLHSAKLLDWILEEPESTLATAAFFHDLLLFSDEEAVIRSNGELDNLNDNMPLVERVKGHAGAMANLVNKSKKFGPQASQLIREHHGSPKGEGFGSGWDNQKIGNISKIFLIAEEWANLILKPQKDELKFDKSFNINLLISQFEGPEYLEIINTLEFLDAKELDEVYLKLDSMTDLLGTAAEESELVLYRQVSTLLFGIKDIDKDILEKFKQIQFFGEKGVDALERGSANVTDDENSSIRTVTDKITDACRIIKGHSQDAGKFKTLVEGLDERLEQIIGNLELQKVKFGKSVQSIREKGQYIRTDLMIAIGLNDLKRVQIVLSEEQPMLEQLDKHGRTALHQAVILGNLEIVTALIEKGAKNNVTDGKRRSPIYYAIQYDHQECFFYLAGKEARLKQEAMGGMNLAMVAAFRGNKEVVKFLIENGISADVVDAKGKDIHYYARKGGHPDVTQFLKSQ
ncbi:MAG: ankyrin repeat domain-containing protein [Halobacteriovoraceae bacterium]|jgi:response regulator RpfG family c-di-GMP phosphodiesterase|nr:ankyrin repeat domain-containing protein [Halobacteriovoraceae bacterium]MBT5093175.1 ankyrin repeat domain-containing protein [Halobacteriovoraceae bacterium]